MEVMQEPNAPPDDASSFRFQVDANRRHQSTSSEASASRRSSWFLLSGCVLAGLALVAISAHRCLDSALCVAKPPHHGPALAFAPALPVLRTPGIAPLALRPSSIAVQEGQSRTRIQMTSPQEDLVEAQKPGTVQLRTSMLTEVSIQWCGG